MRARLIVTLIVATALAAASPASSFAGARNTIFTFAAPTNPPSISPQPPADQQAQYISTIGVSYDGGTGIITVSEAFYATAYWEPIWQSDTNPNVQPGESPSGATAFLSVQIGPPCPVINNDNPPTNQAEVNFDEDTSGTPPTYSSDATLTGYGGDVTGSLTFDGSAWTATVQSSYFANLDWRCVSIGENDASDPTIEYPPSGNLGSGPQSAYFAGYAPAKPVVANSRNMSAAFVSRLPSGAVLPANEGPACPTADIPVILQGYADCYAEYKRAGRWHLAYGGVKDKDGVLDATISHTGSWRRTWRVCRQYGWQVDGSNLVVPGARHNTLVSNNDCGREGGDSDVYFVQQEMIYGCGRGSIPNRGGCRVGAKSVGWLFTYSAGFNSIGIFPCKHRGRTYTCTNAVGDSFRYTS